ncbi:MAG: type II toxin-antitoxin system PemK/MazF family toxin [Planctomycetales bacterium]
MTRGDVVVIDFPQAPGAPPKRRPAVVVQSDRNNRRLSTAIFAMATSNVRLAGTEHTQVLVDVATPEGQASGLARVSAIKCENLYTLPQSLVLRVIGRLPHALLAHVDAALKHSLSLR